MNSLPEDIQRFVDASPDELRQVMEEIGNTPMSSIYLVIRGEAHKVHLKLEGYNPTGSMKARTGYALLQNILRNVSEEAPRNFTVIESTSGNLGVALALFCAAYRVPFVAVVDPKTTAENLRTLQVLGARIEMVQQPDSTGGYLLSRLRRVRELCESRPEYIWTNQYMNLANPLVHYTSTGPEIYQQMGGQVDVIFLPVSTGGTLAGVGRFFREKSPKTRIIGVDAFGSVIFGNPPAPRKLTGIGSSQTSSFLTPDLFDDYLLVNDIEAFAFCRALDDANGCRLGGSSGAVLAACARYLEAHPEANQVVCMCADRGENYASSIYNDQWLHQQGFSITKAHLGAVQEILPTYSGIF